MENHYVLYQKGLTNSTEVFIYNGKVCIRNNSSGGEHLLYISVSSEDSLLTILEPKNFLKRIFLKKYQNNIPEKERKGKIVKLLAQKFSYGDTDPDKDIRSFLKKYKIKSEGQYWPDSDRF
ncbi:hypothetical protein [Flagellimonas eckloniae]|uniref:Uncharacterized protein n=1 Tax=Flagellimonas eckloniae TaxID=346185 RepID=A0A0Q1DL44_9FLAO|nr:hypothetical protein [Allomuricauda eckloniae]KQC29639.1 hypothetical protein AAY42_06875 [Allomuricauda eckloniae]